MSRLRGSWRATVRAMARTAPENGADLLTVGLSVFFVALIAIVAALLVLPALS